MVQLDEIAARVKGPCDLVKLERCGHSPFRDQPERTLGAVAGFIARVRDVDLP
jgi:pimeloyl-ACP methyl ester carboxylesterase